MLWFFYYLTAIILPVVFYKHIHITSLSVIPLFCMILSLFLAFFWHGNTEKEENYPMPNTETLTNTEYKALAKYCNMAHRLFVPLHVPLLLLFSNGVKLLSLLLFMISLIAGPLMFRIRYGKQLSVRLKKEQEDKKIQMQKEEQGKLK